LTPTTNRICGTLAVSALLVASPAWAQKAYGPGVSDTEIKLGQSTPLSGPASAFGAGAGRAVVGYFEMLNEKGGINGRKINFTQLDNAYNAPKAIEQSRRLVEDVGVLAEVGTIGTVPNIAIQKFLNSSKVPQLFITAGGRRFNDPKTYPWTVPLYPDFETEGAVVAKYILKDHPNAKIGVFYQNDDFGRDYVKGLRRGLGAKASLIIAEASYELSDPTIDSQIVKLKAEGVDTVIEQSAAKATAQSIRKIHELNWNPLHIIGGSSASLETVLKPAGLEASKGLVTTQFLKQPGDPAWANDAHESPHFQMAP
jgi:ABC-type branched-subunit amino acid transport system substrate-binding protein